MARMSPAHRCLCLAIATFIVVSATSTIEAQQQASYEVVSSFTLSFDGGMSPSSLRQDSDGTLYGTTSSGGRFNGGVLFRLDPSGTATVLHHFSGVTDGTAPFKLVRASDGRFYGATQTSGAGTSGGTIFSFRPGGELTTVHTFSQSERPVIDLFAASDGRVYGITQRGGAFQRGSIFVVEPDSGVTTLHSIRTAESFPTSFVKGSDGRFYVTTSGGGASGRGSVLSIDEDGTIEVLYSFGATPGDGWIPGGLIQGRDGRLYGTTPASSGTPAILATVFALDLAGHYALLGTFAANTSPGPADVLEASDGNFYCVTQRGLFRFTASGMLTPLDGGFVAPGELFQGMDGRLYTSTAGGGTDSGGTIIAKELSGPVTTLYEFTIGAGAGGPGRPRALIQGDDGQFYGTTTIETSIERPGRTGTVYAMDAAGTRTTLHSIGNGTPTGSLFQSADGSLIGTTYAYVSILGGMVFRVSPAGVITRLASGGGLAGVVEARDGRLYGGAGQPGEGAGTLFRIEANATLNLLHFFGTASAYPVGDPIQANDGTLYGATLGGYVWAPNGMIIGRPPATIFQFDLLTGTYADRYAFPDDVKPSRGLIQGTDGLFYGTTINGGAAGLGTVFSLDAAGTLTTLHDFANTDGANPEAGVIQGLDGRLYGTTRNGGTFGYGTVFVIGVTGGLTTLHHFALSDGGNPIDELFQANDGAVYGTAQSGGPLGGGVVFRVRLTTMPSEQYFQLVSRISGKCLDVAGGSTEPGAPVLQWTCHGGPHQQWRLEPAGSGAFRIISRHSGQALDVAAGSVDNGATILQWPVHGGDNQMWTLEPATGGYLRPVVRHSGKAMDVELASMDDGARVLQWSPHSGANQQWLLRPSN